MKKIGDLSPPTDISPIYRRFFGDIYRNFFSLIYHHDLSCRNLPIHDISTIYLRYILTFSSLVAGRGGVERGVKAFVVHKIFISTM